MKWNRMDGTAENKMEWNELERNGIEWNGLNGTEWNGLNGMD